MKQEIYKDMKDYIEWNFFSQIKHRLRQTRDARFDDMPSNRLYKLIR